MNARRRRFLRNAILTFGLLFVVGGVFVGWAYRAARQTPEFYAERRRKVEQFSAQAADQFERRMLELRNDARRTGAWETVITEEQINAWLAKDLPEKHPDVLPREIEAPLVAISRDQVRLGFQYHHPRGDTVLWLEFEPFLTEDRESIAIRLRKGRAGLLPLPLAQVAEEIRSAAGHAHVPLRWKDSDGFPVALVTLPESARRIEGRQVTIERLELREGAIVVAGHSK